MKLNVDQSTLEKAIIKEVADQILSRENDGQWDRLVNGMHTEIKARIDKLFAERAEAQIQDAIDAAIEEGFDREYQAVDAFGSKVGDKTTIRKRLNEIISKYWSERVGKDGRQTTSSYSTMSRAEYVMMKAIGEDFAAQVKQEAVNVTASLKDGLRVEMRNWIDSALGDLFHVRSATDKEEGRRK